MRLLHVSDWHIGLTTGPFERRPDHDRVIDEIIAIVRERKPDLVLHTGDLYQTQFPRVEDLRYGIDRLQELSALAPVLVIRGNHDSDRLFSVFDDLLGDDARLRFFAAPAMLGSETVDPIRRYPAADGSRIALAALPFVHSNRTLPFVTGLDARTSVFADRIGGYERALGTILLNGLNTSTDVAIFAAHQYVGGALKSGSERPLHVGDEYATRAADVPLVSYAAYGHIHRPQSISAACPARYAGSPIAVDYGEEGEAKSVVFVEAQPGRAPSIEIIALSGGRPLKSLTTEFGELDSLAERLRGTLCRLTVRTETPRSDLAREIKDRFPSTDFVDITEDCAALRVEAVTGNGDGVHASIEELFAEYLAELKRVKNEPATLAATFARVLAAAQSQEPYAVPELAEPAS